MEQKGIAFNNFIHSKTANHQGEQTKIVDIMSVKEKKIEHHLIRIYRENVALFKNNPQVRHMRKEGMQFQHLAG